MKFICTKFFVFIFVVLLLISCSQTKKLNSTTYNNFKSNIVIKNTTTSNNKINTNDLSRDKLISHAKTLIGTPYKYGSTDIEKGLDCSGFVWVVFNHFNIKAPRASVDYSNIGKAVSPEKSKAGDIILFTGEDKKSGKVGHLGFVYKNDKSGFQFIHSTSGKKKGVMISNMSSYFYERFIKIINYFDE